MNIKKNDRRQIEAGHTMLTSLVLYVLKLSYSNLGILTLRLSGVLVKIRNCTGH